MPAPRPYPGTMVLVGGTGHTVDGTAARRGCNDAGPGGGKIGEEADACNSRRYFRARRLVFNQALSVAVSLGRSRGTAPNESMLVADVAAAVVLL